MEIVSVGYFKDVSVLQFVATLYNVLNYPSPRPHNKHSNVQLQFLSLCRLQQLAMSSNLTVVMVPLLLAIPAVISWLWLVIVPLRVTKLCPEGCWCDVGGYVVDCSNTSLHNIPSIYLTHVQELVLNDNNITSLEKDIFVSKGLTELNLISLDRCGLQIIELGALNGLTKLTYLLMQINGLGGITGRTFEGMSRLEYLVLRYNRIEHLDVDMFWGLVSLQHLYLEGNELLKLHPDIFVGLPKLERLDLGANRGLHIPTDRHFITSYPLKFLDISDCNVSSVSVETFAKVSALETLDLRYNKLRSIDINILKILPKLSTLYLYGNALQCDCQLQEVWRWCQDHDIWTGNMREDIWCEGKVMWQWVLEESQCDQDNISNRFEYKQKRNKHLADNIGPEFAIIHTVLTWLYIFLSIFGAIGNIIPLIIIICNKDMRTVPNMYILNLAISDMIFLTLPIAKSLLPILSSVNINPEFGCAFVTFCYRMSVDLSAYSIVVLSFQRYRVIVNPFSVRVSSQPTWRVTASTICGVWIVAALFAIPSAFSKFVCSVHIQNVHFMDRRYIPYHTRVFTFELFVFCLLPLFVIAFFYIMTACHLVKSTDLTFEETQNPQLNKRKNIAKYVMGLTIVFLISYGPYHAIWSYFFFKLGHIIHLPYLSASDFLLLNLISYCLFVMNSCLNPVALFCTSSLFRKHLKRYLCCCCKRNSPPTDIELRRRN